MIVHQFAKPREALFSRDLQNRTHRLEWVVHYNAQEGINRYIYEFVFTFSG